MSTTSDVTLSRRAQTAQPALASVSTVSALTSALRQRVLGGEFRPREQLREQRLVEEYGVARQSVRAALHSLCQSGVLEHQPNRGVFVPSLTRADVADIFVLRTAVEVQAVTMLASRGAVDGEVDKAMEGLKGIHKGATWSEVITADLEFHAALVAATGAQRLIAAFSTLTQELHLSLIDLQKGKLASGWLVASHQEILDSILSADAGRAESQIRSHLESSLRELHEIHGWAHESGG